MADKRVTGRPAAKEPVPEKTDDSDMLSCCESDRTPSFDETTIRALEDARASIGVTEYADAAELFEHSSRDRD